MDLPDVTSDETGGLTDAIGLIAGDSSKQLQILRAGHLMQLVRVVERTLEVRFGRFAGIDRPERFLNAVAVAPLEADVQDAF